MTDMIQKEQRTKWTAEQQQVIDTRDHSILVSAAAGSGKTAVLVERILELVCDRQRPVDIDRLLVVTFTNAAAAEMRERIGQAIEQKLDRDPQNEHLLRQQTLVNHAMISTIDSFCLKVVKNHFHCIDIEPGFRIGDPGELKLLGQDIADQVLEEAYAQGDPEFLKFAGNYGSAKSDETIRQMMIDLYEYVQSEPWPEEWLERCRDSYRCETTEQLEEKPWALELSGYLRTCLEEIRQDYRKCLEMTRMPDGPEGYEGMILGDLEQVEALLEEKGLCSILSGLQNISFSRMPALRKYAGSVELKDYVSETRKRLKDRIKKYQSTFGKLPQKEQLVLLKETGESFAVLKELVKRYGKALMEEKQRLNVLSFSDVEHFALEILRDRTTRQPTAVAAEYRHQFAEVMIDEYQDSNYVQEEILTAVSGLPEGRQNLFMVGDVKQSIYRFRQARPDLFVQKYLLFAKGENRQMRIDLHHNFRSQAPVVDTVNEVFSHIMARDLGDVEYDKDAALYQRAKVKTYEDPDAGRTECILINGGTDQEDEKAMEARAVARRIRQLVEEHQIRETGSEKVFRYGDITILLRSLSGWSNVFQKVFEEEGVPLVVTSATGYFSATEVQDILNFLKILDNPRQDIPLLGVLRSGLGNFTDEELAQIRTTDKKAFFYQVCRDCLKEESALPQELKRKLTDFWDMYENFRSRVKILPIHQLLTEILEETGYSRRAMAMPGGLRRRANLDMLVEKAIAFEKTAYHGLFHFVRYIDQLQKYDEDFGEAEIISDHDNSVRLMTIHKSKGLQFPVVVLAGMGKQFNERDSQASMILHPVGGAGLKWVDRKAGKKRDTLMRAALARKNKMENMGEELRILYVAMTRAEDKLILSGKRKKESSDIEPEPWVKLPFTLRTEARCYWDWVLPALAGSWDKVHLTIWDPEESEQEEISRTSQAILDREALNEAVKQYVPKELTAALDEQLSWTYPYAGEDLPKQKVSVSELKHRAIEAMWEEEEEQVSLFPEQVPSPYVPRFIEEKGESGGTRYGTAVHRFLECVDFAALPQPEQIPEFVRSSGERILENGLMDPEDYKLLHMPQVETFLRSEPARRMADSARKGGLYRERPFVMSLPADRVWPDSDSKQDVLIQGIIDVFWEEPEGIVLLDYKTDRVNTPEELAARYRTQLKLYGDALSRYYGDKEVKEIWIWSFRLGQPIRL